MRYMLPQCGSVACAKIFVSKFPSKLEHRGQGGQLGATDTQTVVTEAVSITRESLPFGIRST